MKEFKFGSFWSDVNPMFHEVQTEPSGLKMAHRTKIWHMLQNIDLLNISTFILRYFSI